jgi:hypothetical protein
VAVRVRRRLRAAQRARPRTTEVDFLVSGPRGAVALEAKFTEKGLGRCSSAGRAEGCCDERILGDRPYWKVAREAFGLAGPSPRRRAS